MTVKRMDNVSIVVENIDAAIEFFTELGLELEGRARLGKRGAKLVGDVAQYEDMYRLCYIRGPEGILIGLAQELGQRTSRTNPMRDKS